MLSQFPGCNAHLRRRCHIVLIGWTPSTFKSSREARASTSKAARPEDFMDEEDLEELRNSKIIVDKTEEMDLLGGTQGELSRRAGAALPDDE